MQQRGWIWIFFSIMIVAFMVVLFSLNRQQATQDNGSHTHSEAALSEQQKHYSDGPAKDVRANGKSGKERATTETSEPVSLQASDFQEGSQLSKAERIFLLHERLRNAGCFNREEFSDCRDLSVHRAFSLSPLIRVGACDSYT